MVARAIKKQEKPGWERLAFLIKADGKPLETTADHDGTKYTRDEDMVLCVKGVIAAVGSKIPLAIFDNIFMRLYLNSLNSKH
jgi:hypothetical protein